MNKISENQSMTGKICMVTGATSGIGKATAIGLAKHGATVVIVGRNENKCKATSARIKHQTKNSSVDFLLADLSDQTQIRDLATEFKRRHDRLHVLVNNAGARFMRYRKTMQGVEMTLALNHLAYFLLTNLFLDLLRASVPARIINISSGSQTSEIDFENLSAWKSYDGRKGICTIKACQHASQIVKESKKVALSDCICRKHNKLISKGCQRAHEEMCIYLSPLAEYFIEQGWGKEASVDDALEALERGEEAGLVRNAWLNVQKNPTDLCQCCPCCCHNLRADYELKIPNALAKSNFVPVIDLEPCTGCQSCVDICPMDALVLDGDEKVAWNPARCIGCGLCVSRCPTEAIKLERVSDGQATIPPETYNKLMIAIAHEKRKTYFYK